MQNRYFISVICVLTLLTAGCIPKKFSANKNGEILIYESNTIYITDAKCSFLKTIPVKELENIDFAEWSPDAKKIVCVGRIPQQRPVTSKPLVDKDGNKIGEIQTPEGPEESGIFIIDMIDNKIETLLIHKDITWFPQWSPDMKYISWVELDDIEKDKSNLVIWDLKTNAGEIIEDTGCIHKWSSDGRSILFSLITSNERQSDREAMSKIAVRDTKRGETTCFVRVPAFLLCLEWGIDDKQIFFTSPALNLPMPLLPSETADINYKYRLYCLSEAGTAVKEIGNGKPVLFFTLSPAKTKVLYIERTSKEEVKGMVWVADIDGKNPVKIGENDKDFIPFWVSDKEIMFQENDTETIWLVDASNLKKIDFSKLLSQKKQESLPQPKDKETK